jgi:hypothetical protein
MLVVKQKRVNLKSSNSKTTKNRIIKIRSYFRSKFAKKDGMKIIQRCNTKRCKTVVSLYNPGIEFTILADNTMLEAATRRVHNFR